MRHAIYPLILSVGLIFVSCGQSSSVADRISSAELAFANENVNATREICHDVLQEKDRSGIEASQMARLSILYMQLNERTDDPEDVEYAVRCFREAYQINPDSATSFYRSLSVEDMKYAMTLSSIVHSLDNPQEFPAENDIYTDSAEMAEVERELATHNSH